MPPSLLTALPVLVAGFIAGSARHVEKRGPDLIDGDGRHVLLRGVNFGGRAKLPPFLPIYPLAAHPHDPVPLDPKLFEAELASPRIQHQLDLLKGLGFNVVRLPFIWKAIEPRPNDEGDLLPEGRVYLESMARIIAELERRGLWVIVDLHSDLAHEVFGGDGFPDWALALGPDASPPTPAGFDSSLWQQRNLFNPALRATLRSFWRNDLTNTAEGLLHYPVRSDFMRTAGAMVRFLESWKDGAIRGAILGYEPFNEPYQATIDEVEFERTVLPGFYAEFLSTMSLVGSNAMVFIEPRVDWSLFTASPRTELLDAPGFAAFIANQRVVFSYHYYDGSAVLAGNLPGGGFGVPMQNRAADWPPIFDSMARTARASGLVPFLSEFGAMNRWRYATPLRPGFYRNQARAALDMQFQQIETTRVHSTMWQFDLYADERDADRWNHEDFSMLGPGGVVRERDLISRPYPLRSSARLSSLAFDAETHTLTLELSGAVSAAPTLIYLPAEDHYPGGRVTVHATGARTAWDEAAQLLYWWPDRSAEKNRIVVTPGRAANWSVAGKTEFPVANEPPWPPFLPVGEIVNTAQKSR